MNIAIAFCAVWLGLCLCAPLRAQQPEAAEESQPRYFTRDVSFEDVDLATVQGWLARVGITLPFSMEGKLSAQTRFGVPMTALGDGRKYRFHGTASSPRLLIDGLELLDVTAEVDYAEGVLALKKLQLLLPEEPGDRETAGSVAGAARMELLPRGDFTAELSLQRAPVAPVLAVFPELRGLAVARLSGKADARVPVDKFQDLAAWNVEGQLNVADFASRGFTVNSATAEAQLVGGTLTVSRFRADSAGGTAEGRGRISFTGDRPFSADFEITDGDLAQLAGILAPPGGSLDVSGNTNAALNVQGTLQPVKVKGQGRLTATDVRLDRFEIPSLEVPLAFSGDTLTIDGARAEIGEGTLRATAVVALGPEAASSATVTWENVQLAALARLLAVEQVIPRVGTVSGRSGGRLEIEAPAGALREPARWSGRLEAAADNLAAYAVDFRRVDVSLRLADGELSVERLEATEAGESLTATGRIVLTSPYAFTADIDWKQGRLQPLRHVLRETPAPAVRLDGRFDLAMNVSGQLEPRRLRADASLTAESLRWNDVAIFSAEVRADINDDELHVPQLVIRLYDGEVQGSADVRLGAEEAGTASLTWKQVDVAALLKDALAYPAQSGSTSQGEVRVEIPAGETMEPRAWHVVGSAAVDGFHVRDQTVDQARLEIELTDRLLKVGRLALETNSGSVSGKGQIAVDEPYAFQTSLKMEQFDLALARDAVALGAGTELEIGGIVNLEADLSGKLTPLTVTGGGSAHGEQLRAGALLLDDVGFDFAFDEHVLNFADLKSNVYGGTVQGSAQLPLTSDEAVHVDARWKDINLNSAINAFLIESPVSLSGVVGGSLSADVPAGKMQEVAAWRAKIGFQTFKLESQGQPAGQLEGEASLADDVLKYSLTGTFLGGPLELEGRWPSLGEALRALGHPDASDDSAALQHTSESRSGGQRGGLSWNVLLQPPRLAGEQAEYEGRLSWREVTLARLRGFLPSGTLPEALNARASIELQFRHRPGGLPTGDGELTLDALAWDGSPLSERLRGRVRLGENQLHLLGFRGRYADGLAQLGARIPLSHPNDLSYEILLTRGRFRPALAPFLDLGDQLDGRLDGRLVGRFGPLWKLTGTAELSETTLAGAEAGSWRVPLIISYDPPGGRARYAFRRVRGELANGRVSGDAEIISTSRLRIEGDFRFDRLDLDPLMHSFGVESQIGKGRISGTTSLGGSNVEGLADLSALVDARLQNTTTDAVPFLGPLQHLMPAVLPSTTFDEGQLRGRLNRNVFQLQRLSLAGHSAEVYATGSVSLTGRLDLEVTAGTGRLRRGQRIARILLRSLLIAAQPELALVLRINNFLADRVIQAQVTGTTTSPVIRIQPLQLLEEEALRFFLTQAAG